MAALLSAAPGCTLGLGAVAPGINQHTVEVGRKTWTDSEGNGWTRIFYASQEMDVGVALASSMGAAFASMDSADRKSTGTSMSLGVHARVCPSRSLCIGPDLDMFERGSTLVRKQTSPAGAVPDQELDLSVRGWGVVPQLQLAVFGPLWIEGGVGGAKTRVQFGEDESSSAWNLAWSAGGGLAFASRFGVRINYVSTRASGAIRNDNFDLAGSALQASLILGL